MDALKAVPKSNATNAYDLLSDICRIVTEEPKRIAMAEWIVTDTDYANDIGLQMPQCGTVGCIGGWTETLRPHAGGYAAQILGLTRVQADELFLDSDKAPQFLVCGPLLYEPPQTPEHAAHVVEHIRAFQQKYEAQLKAKAV